MTNGKELVKFQDALSLVLIIDRMENDEDLMRLQGPVRDYVERMGLRIPDNLRKLISDVITVLMDRAKISKDVVEDINGLIDKKEYQTMFDGLVESILAKDRRAEEAIEKAETLELRLWESERIRQELERDRQELERKYQELERKLGL